MVFYDTGNWFSGNYGRVDKVAGKNCHLKGDVLFFSLLVSILSIEKINCGPMINANATIAINKVLLIKY